MYTTLYTIGIIVATLISRKYFIKFLRFSKKKTIQGWKQYDIIKINQTSALYATALKENTLGNGLAVGILIMWDVDNVKIQLGANAYFLSHLDVDKNISDWERTANVKMQKFIEDAGAVMVKPDMEDLIVEVEIEDEQRLTIEDLEKDLQTAIENEDYKEAAKLQKQIDSTK